MKSNKLILLKDKIEKKKFIWMELNRLILVKSKIEEKDFMGMKLIKNCMLHGQKWVFSFSLYIYNIK